MKPLHLLPFLLLLLTLLRPATAHAQLGHYDHYARFSASLTSTEPVYDVHGVTKPTSHNLSGFTAGALVGLNLTRHHLPLFLEFGPEFTFVRRSDQIDYWDGDHLTGHDDIETRLLTLGTPINLTYHVPLLPWLRIAPSAGLNVKAHLQAKDSDGHSDYNLLLDDDVHRLQLGCNVGCGIYLSRLYLGLRFDKDLTPFRSLKHLDESYQSLHATLGLKF